MAVAKSVLVIGLDPNRPGFMPPAWAEALGWTAERISFALESDRKRLEQLGYRVELCLADFGDTDQGLVAERLKQQSFDFVVIGAGIRTDPKRFILFESLINLIHAHAPQAKISFNRDPADTAEAVLRWV
jgi:hypothetical protein